MKLRHAALVLAGWYLMMPPATNSSIGIDLGAPLSDWVMVESFDSARECKAAHADMMKGNLVGKAPQNATVTERKRAAIALSIRHARCIASDDPRLKGT